MKTKLLVCLFLDKLVAKNCTIRSSMDVFKKNPTVSSSTGQKYNTAYFRHKHISFN